jgi:molybdopterin-containing oxidoreductase family iron-sulfur binding subunit
MLRRTFLKLFGATAGLAGLTACTGRLPAKIVPYVDRPPELTPGIPQLYATSAVLDGYASGILVETHEGRPTKVEGNPDHPSSLGAASPFEQALVLQLYDPCRARLARRGKDPIAFEAFAAAAESWRDVHFVLEPSSSPLVKELLARIPGAHVHFHAPLTSGTPLAASRALLGRALVARPQLLGARRVLALDSDFLAAGPGHLRHAHDFAQGREPTSEMNRLYVVEPSPTSTGMSADHRLARRSSDVERVARAVLGEVLRLSGDTRGVPEKLLEAPAEDRAFARACARDLWDARRRALVLAGERQTRGVHACVIALNDLLEHGRFSDPVLQEGEPLPEKAETVIVVGANPVYSLPGFEHFLARAKNTVRVGLYEDETAACCEWFVPLAHTFECWGDARAHDGTISIVQPLVVPLHAGKSLEEVLGCFLPRLPDLAERYTREERQRGFVRGSELPLVEAHVAWSELPALLAARERSPALEITFARDAAVHDGRFTNNPWLLELPDPATKLTWDKGALLGPRTARQLGVANEDVIAISRDGARIEIPVWVLPGHAEDAITVPLGYGRRGAESLACGLGADAFPLARDTSEVFGTTLFASDAKVERVWARSLTGAPPARVPLHARLATTQHHGSLEGRLPFVEAALGEHADAPRKKALPVYREGPQWAMTIDLSKCSGCNACVVACQAENNIPVVGKEGVLQGRAMHWMRIDRYFSGPEGDPRFANQPMLCQHCEKAPCEYVCPVNATTHSPDGLNEQTYNRCVGTRFCSNNCPYKVRKFNWFDYSAQRPVEERMVLNPDVTVRQRGVMEKCTLCVQRIREKEIEARREGRPIRDGELKTACQQTCASRAIVFGDLADARSEVARSFEDPRRYSVLGELGTLPRVQYLARIRNPNPELAS